MIKCVFVSADETLQRHVMSVVRNPENSGRLVLELAEEAGQLSRDRVTQIIAAEPEDVFIDLGDSMTGLRVLDLLAKEAPGIAIIASGAAVGADTLLRIIQAGASEYLPRPFGLEEVSAAFQRVRRRFGATRREEAVSSGKLATVFSPKGGVGVTTVAVNLAVALQQLTGKSTLLLDLSPTMGTAALTMGLQPRYSYIDVIQNFHRIDEELVHSFVEVHASGVHVLSSPPRADSLDGPSMDAVLGLLRLCRSHFSQVVIDGGSSLTAAVDSALAESDHRILVTTPELPTLRNLKRVLELFGEQHQGNGKRPWRLLLNQYSEGVGLTARDVETALGLTIGTIIPREDTLVTESINVGRPVVLAGRSHFARSILELASEMAGPDRIVADRGARFGFLRPFIRRTTTAKEGN